MPKNRFFLDQKLEETVILMGVEHHHLSHVMRLQPKEEIELVNGKGALAQATILEVSRHDTLCKITSVESASPPLFHLHLAIPFMRMPKLELALEKSTELGADLFHLYPADHSEKKELTDHQIERLRQILISSLKQCGRLFLPSVQIQPFEHLFRLDAAFFFGDPKGDAIPQRKGSALFISGPEKGFSESEREVLEQKGATGIRLSKNILRAETAPIAASCLLSIDKSFLRV